MFSKFIEKLTGKDDVERVMAKKDMKLLVAHLKTRRLLIPRRPKRFLDASNFTDEEFLELMEGEAMDLAGDQFEPWIMEMDGKNRLPAFSSQKTMQAFSARVSQSLNKVFSLGCAEFLFEDVAKWSNVDVIDLNRFREGSMELFLTRTSVSPE